MASGMAWPRYPGIIIGIQLCFLARSLGVDFICRQTLPCDGSWHVQLYIQSRESNHLSLIYMSFLKPVSVGRKMERSDWLGLVMCSFLRQAGGEVGPTCTTWINNGIEVSFPRKTDVLLPEEGGLNVPQTNSLIIQTHTRKIPDVGKKRSILSVVKFKFLVPLFAAYFFMNHGHFFIPVSLLLALEARNTLDSGWWRWWIENSGVAHAFIYNGPSNLRFWRSCTGYL